MKMNPILLVIAILFSVNFLSAESGCYYYGSELKCLELNRSPLKSVGNWPVIAVKNGPVLPLTGEIGVSFKKGFTNYDVAQIMKKYGLKIARKIDGMDHLKIFKAASGTDLFETSKEIYESGKVKWAQPVWLEEPALLSTPDDTYYVDQWHHTVINSEKAWDYAVGYPEAKIAVLDSGVDTFHPDLNLQMGMSFVPTEQDVNPNMGSFQNQYMMAHGTCVSGIAAGQGFNGAGISGVCPKCSVIPVKYIGLEQNYPPLDRKVQAVKWAVDAGAWVINNSWTIAVDKDRTTEECISIPADNFVKELIDYAETNGRGGLGTVIVWSAGNSTCDTLLNPSLNDDRIVVVSALDVDSSYVYYSNYGVNVNIAAPAGEAIIGKGGLVTTDVSTPGKGFNPAFNNADPSYVDYQDQFFTKYFDGTSAAAPVVSGAFGLMLSIKPEMTLAEAIDCMKKAAAAPQFDCEHGDLSACFGAGILDVGKMVEMAFNGECGGGESFHCFEDWQCEEGKTCNVDTGVCGDGTSEVPDNGNNDDTGEVADDTGNSGSTEQPDDMGSDDTEESSDTVQESPDDAQVSENSDGNTDIPQEDEVGCALVLF